MNINDILLLGVLPRVRERFTSFCAPGAPDACWPWVGGCAHGYGAFSVEGQVYRAHRIAWVLARGPIPAGLWVLHRCDNPPCCNPSHLFLGTGEDNIQDMNAKQRHTHGVRQYMAVLDPEKVRAIRRDSRPHQVIADAYGVSRPAVTAVKRRYSWKHVE